MHIQYRRSNDLYPSFANIELLIINSQSKGAALIATLVLAADDAFFTHVYLVQYGGLSHYGAGSCPHGHSSCCTTLINLPLALSVYAGWNSCLQILISFPIIFIVRKFILRSSLEF
ncbi:hypothetical protein BaRGS_00002545 [Batillaria attramentaria]|uniref:Uncharacterized protein n=1 Tax=Batillaria attramentaria TaxID=370345 RepID=A0ABD0M5J9_9CAEN